MDKTKFKRTKVYEVFDIPLDECLEDAFTAIQIAGKMAIPGYYMEDAVREIAVLDVSTERKLLIMGAMNSAYEERCTDHMRARNEKW
jgi:hypothetical protein